MNYKLHWRTSCVASCIHAADVVARGLASTDSSLSSAIGESVHQLTTEVQESEIRAEQFWKQLLALSSQTEDVNQLVENTLRDTLKRDSSKDAVSHISLLVTDIVSAVSKHVGDINELLKLRAVPIRQQWEARGPGMMSKITQLSNESLTIDNATVVLVLPVSGGGGDVHSDQDCVRFEAVLTDTMGQLPEVIRLAWLLSRLAIRRSRRCSSSPLSRLALVEQLAALPLVLSAADHVELLCFDRSAMDLAVSSWIHGVEPTESLSEVVYKWWRGFTGSQTPLTIEMYQLDKTLQNHGAFIDSCE